MRISGNYRVSAFGIILVLGWLAGRQLFSLNLFGGRRKRRAPLDVSVKIIQMEPTGKTKEFVPIIRLAVEVTGVDGQPPRTVTSEERIPYEFLPLLQPEAIFPGKIDPGKPGECTWLVGSWAITTTLE